MQDRGHSAVAPDPLRQAGTLVLLVRAMDQQLRAATSPDTLSLAELSVLGQVDRGVDLPSQVARALRMDPARVTHVVDRLVAHGSLTRAVDPEDRRRWRLRLTERGSQSLSDGRADMRAAMERLLDGLTPEEREGLEQGIAGVRRVLDALP